MSGELIRATSTGQPNHVMVGIDRPGGGVRLYASRDIPERELRWGLAQDQYHTGTGWHIDAEMRLVLIIDGEDWAEVYAKAFQIWANHDRSATLERAADLNPNTGKTVSTATGLMQQIPGSDLTESRRITRGRILDGPAHPEGKT